MDEWSILNEVDVIAEWPTEHKKSVLEAGAKWKERKEGLEALNKVIEQNPRLSTSTMTVYGELMDELRKILDRESNIVVVTTAIRTVELLANGLRKKFSGFVGMVVPFLIKRAKDKKKNVRDSILAAMASVADTTTPERLQKDIIDWFGIQSPESKQTLLQFLFAYFCRQYAPDISFVKTIAPLIVKATSDSDVAVRDKACHALGALKRLMGDSISAFLLPISTDTAKIEKINQYEKEAAEEFAKFLESQPKVCGNGESAEISERSENGEGVLGSSEPKSAVSLDPWELLEPEDISKKFDVAVEAQLVDKNWKERVAGAENIKKAVDGVGRLQFSERLLEIQKILIKIIEKDVNVNVSMVAAQILKEIAQKARFQFAPIALRSFPVVFEKLKDKKAVLRDALIEFCDEAANTTPLSTYSEAVVAGLANKNPQARQQTALFLSRFFSKNDTRTIEDHILKQLSEHVAKTTNDADKEVRDAAIRVVASIQKSLGEGVARRLFAEVYDDKLKAEKIPSIAEALVVDFGKSASPEMLRLAKHYQIGNGSSSSKSVAPSATAPKKRPVSAVAPRPPTAGAKPSNAVRPVQSAAPRQAPLHPSVAAVRRAPSPKAAPVTAAPPKPKAFVARPAPNFGAPKPRATVAPAQAPAKPVLNGTSSTASRSAAVRPSGTPIRIVPPTPNVVRNESVKPSVSTTGIRKPIGIARPQTASGSIVPPRSRIGTPSSGIPRPASSHSRGNSIGASSRIDRPPSASRPPSRPGSRNE